MIVIVLTEDSEDDLDPHTCPYKVELYNDYEALCTCSPKQVQQCMDDI